jgi:hypothetical protein
MSHCVYHKSRTGLPLLASLIRVMRNGKLVQKNVELTGPTRSAHWEDENRFAPSFSKATTAWARIATCGPRRSAPAAYCVRAR